MKSFFKLAALVAAFGLCATLIFGFASCSNGSDGNGALLAVTSGGGTTQTDNGTQPGGGGGNPSSPTTPEQGGGQGEQPGGGSGGSQTTTEVLDEDGFVVVEVTKENIASVIANATKNTRLVFLEDATIYSVKEEDLAKLSIKFIFDFTKSSLTNIGIGFNVTNSNVVKLIFSDKIEEIDSFREYTGLTEVTIPASVTKLPRHTFRGCTNLERIKIEGTNVECNLLAFYNCPNLKEIITPCTDFIEGTGAINLEKLTLTVAPKIFGGLKGNTKIKSFVIPEGVEEIANSAFSNSVVETVSIPSTVTKIGAYAFTKSKIGEGKGLIYQNVDETYWYNENYYKKKHHNYSTKDGMTFTRFIATEAYLYPTYKVSDANVIPSNK